MRLHQIDDDIGTILRLFLFDSGHFSRPPQFLISNCIPGIPPPG
jgi:hypothetical protein